MTDDMSCAGSMTLIDGLVIVFLFVAAAHGYRSGAGRQLAALVGWMAGIVLAWQNTPRLERLLDAHGDVQAAVTVAASVGIAFATYLVVRGVGAVVGALVMRGGRLRWLNSLVGAGLGSVVACALVVFAVVVAEWTSAGGGEFAWMAPSSVVGSLAVSWERLLVGLSFR